MVNEPYGRKERVFDSRSLKIVMLLAFIGVISFAPEARAQFWKRWFSKKPQQGKVIKAEETPVPAEEKEQIPPAVQEAGAEAQDAASVEAPAEAKADMDSKTNEGEKAVGETEPSGEVEDEKDTGKPEDEEDSDDEAEQLRRTQENVERIKRLQEFNNTQKSMDSIRRMNEFNRQMKDIEDINRINRTQQMLDSLRRANRSKK